MSRLINTLKDKTGSAFPLTVAITLSLILVFCGISEYFRLVIIAQGVRDAVQTATISTVNDNYNDVYHGVREGYSGAYQPMADDFEESLNYGDIYGRLDSILRLNQSGEYHVKLTSDGKTEFKISDLKVNIKNAPLAPNSPTTTPRFEVDSLIKLEVPVSFGGKLLPPMQINVKVSAGYTPKF